MMDQGPAEAAELFEEAFRHHMAGELPEAVRLYKRSIAAHPTAEAYTFLGWSYSSMGRVAEAIAQCKKAIALDPEFGNPYNDIGAYLIELGKLDEAIPYLQRAVRAERYEARHYPHFNLSRIWLQKDNLAEAIHSLEEAVRLCPNYPAALKELARLRDEESRRARITPAGPATKSPTQGNG
jgi:Tfp pilus assembly protein PilF